MIGNPAPEIEPAGSAPEPPKPQSKKDEREAGETNIGVWVFLSFAGLTLITTAIKGFVPLDLLEAAFWAGLAWFWYKKKIVSQGSRVVVGILAILVAGGEGYSIARHSTGYTYLQEGNIQFRVDNKSGRTDRLWPTGWRPASFDNPASEIYLIDVIWSIPLTNGRWEGQRICFDVQNKSPYVLQTVSIAVSADSDYVLGSMFGGGAAPPVKSQFTVDLHPTLGLLDVGEEDSNFCGSTHGNTGSQWSYKVQTYKGWKR